MESRSELSNGFPIGKPIRSFFPIKVPVGFPVGFLSISDRSLSFFFIIFFIKVSDRKSYRIFGLGISLTRVECQSEAQELRSAFGRYKPDVAYFSVKVSAAEK